MTKPGDVDHYTRVRTYRALARALLRPGSHPARAAAAGDADGRAARSAVARAHPPQLSAPTTSSSAATTPARARTRPASRSTVRTTRRSWSRSTSAELGVRMVPFQELVYLPDEDRYEEVVAHARPARATANLSGTQVRDDFLERGRPLPDWFTRPEVAEILGRDLPAAASPGRLHLVHRVSAAPASRRPPRC